MAKTTSGRDRKDVVKFSAYLSKGLAYIIENQWCKRIGVTKSQFAKQAITYYINHLETKLQEKLDEQKRDQPTTENEGSGGPDQGGT